MNSVTIQKQQNGITLTGYLTQATVMGALLQIQNEKLFSSSKNIQINLSGITCCDSASLAFLTALLRLAKKMQVILTLIEMPRQMRDIADVSGLLPLLPLL